MACKKKQKCHLLLLGWLTPTNQHQRHPDGIAIIGNMPSHFEDAHLSRFHVANRIL
jgi:hypothetical protein